MGTILILTPALIVTKDEMGKAVDMIKECIF